MLKNILSVSNILTKKEQKFVNGGNPHMSLEDHGDKQTGEGCIVGSTLPHLSCGEGLSCISSGHTRVGLCAVEV